VVFRSDVTAFINGVKHPLRRPNQDSTDVDSDAAATPCDLGQTALDHTTETSNGRSANDLSSSLPPPAQTCTGVLAARDEPELTRRP